ILGDGSTRLVLIPPGVAHGVKNLATTRGRIIYLVDTHFSADPDASDEGRLPWDFAGLDLWGPTRGEGERREAAWEIPVPRGAGLIGANFARQVRAAHPDDGVVTLEKLTYAGNPANLKDVEADPRHRFVKGDICDAGLVADLMAEV